MAYSKNIEMFRQKLKESLQGSSSTQLRTRIEQLLGYAAELERIALERTNDLPDPQKIPSIQITPPRGGDDQETTTRS